MHNILNLFYRLIPIKCQEWGRVFAYDFFGYANGLEGGELESVMLITEIRSDAFICASVARARLMRRGVRNLNLSNLTGHVFFQVFPVIWIHEFCWGNVNFFFLFNIQSELSVTDKWLYYRIIITKKKKNKINYENSELLYGGKIYICKQWIC